ncbi:MAG: hypothetical protein E7266_10775 [Lachnospiraceae bacterium]|nr:hypothetical protein [Lachnospiraceae bacterium]
MPQYDRTKIKELKDYLYQSNIHDAEYEESWYDKEKKILFLSVMNPIFNKKIIFTFYNVKIILIINRNEFGSCDTILSLTVEDDYSHIENCTKINGDELEDSIYLLFQMFSCDELHIIAKEVFVDVKEY